MGRVAAPSPFGSDCRSGPLDVGNCAADVSVKPTLSSGLSVKPFCLHGYPESEFSLAVGVGDSIIALLKRLHVCTATPNLTQRTLSCLPSLPFVAPD